MATLLFLAQLLLLGTLVFSAEIDTGPCQQLQNATAGNFSLEVKPTGYRENTTYNVTIKANSNATTKPPVQYVLQALSPENKSLGEWKGVTVGSCSSLDIAILNATQNPVMWTSPDRNVSSVEIRAYIIVPENRTEFKTHTLSRASNPTTSPTTPNSVCTVQSSSFFIALLQLPLLLATSTLLS